MCAAVLNIIEKIHKTSAEFHEAEKYVDGFSGRLQWTASVFKMSIVVAVDYFAALLPRCALPSSCIRCTQFTCCPVPRVAMRVHCGHVESVFTYAGVLGWVGCVRTGAHRQPGAWCPAAVDGRARLKLCHGCRHMLVPPFGS